MNPPPWLPWPTLRTEPAATPRPVQRHAIGALVLEVHSTSLPQAQGGWLRQHSATLHWGTERLAFQCSPSRGAVTGRHSRQINAAFIIGSAAAPDLIVHVGDISAPGEGGFHLLHQLGRQLVCTRLCWSADARLGWHGSQRGTAHGQMPVWIEGGRWLALGDACLYDMQTRRTVRDHERQHDALLACC